MQFANKQNVLISMSMERNGAFLYITVDSFH